MENKHGVLSVSEVNEYVKYLLDSDTILSRVAVRGEISNFTNHYKTGHLYFSIKDESACLKAVMFRSDAMRLNFVPENGMKVIVTGRISAFVRDGQYQLYAASMQPDGIGALYMAYEQLKNKLEAEGLFRDDRKKPLPAFPARIGVITSPTGAAVRDILNITKRRYPLASILIYPALVQGEGAVPSLLRGLRTFTDRGDVDIIIIGRGGGSLEDLWAFNDEALARAIAACQIPVISAVGHETDFTICDFVADKRAPTPSAAAELAVPDSAALRGFLSQTDGRLNRLLSDRIGFLRKRLGDLQNRRCLTSPSYLLDEKKMMLVQEEARLDHAALRILELKKAEYARLSSLLEAVSPLKVLSRGFAAVYDSGETLVRSVHSLQSGDALRLRFSDGAVDAKVTDIHPDPETPDRPSSIQKG